jgi:DNA-binding MarR family transcriptional regulator
VVLAIASESEPRRLAEMLWLGRSTVVNALTRLEKRGFITRSTATNDRRLVVVRITASGHEMVEEGARRQADLLNSLAWEMDAHEVDALARLARRVWRLNYRRVPKSIDSSPRVSEATT